MNRTQTKIRTGQETDMAVIRCMNCMKEFDSVYGVCPHCGFIPGTPQKESYHLPVGSGLHGNRYTIGTVVGYGGFGVVYRAWDNELSHMVAVKEYFPTQYLSRISGEEEVHIYDPKNDAAFRKGKEEFLNEARVMARFNEHPNIIHIYDFFEENGTAYFIMEFLDGISLKEYIKSARTAGKVINVDTAISITKAVLNALKATHAVQIIHRDIKPANIFILKDHTIKLFDFGAARLSSTEQEKTRTIVLTPGYAPPEQYQRKSRQGPYTDIYAMGAVLYEMVTGIKPDESVYRKIDDKMLPPDQVNANVPLNISNAIMRAMALPPEIRFQNVDQFNAALTSPKVTRNAVEEVKHRKVRLGLIIAGIALVFAVTGISVFLLARKTYSSASPDGAVLDVWYPLREEDSTASAGYTDAEMQEMVSEFQKAYPGAVLHLEGKPADTYAGELETAFETGGAEMPELFDSSTLPEEDMAAYAESPDGVFDYLKQSEASACYFLGDSSAQAVMETDKQIPLSFEVSAVYLNNMADQGAGEAADLGEFLEGKTAKYTGSSDDYLRINQEMAGKYSIDTDSTAEEGSKANGSHLFSVSRTAEEKNRKAAEQLLDFMLSDNAENALILTSGCSGLPVNSTVMQSYEDVNPEWDFLEERIPALVYGGAAGN